MNIPFLRRIDEKKYIFNKSINILGRQKATLIFTYPECRRKICRKHPLQSTSQILTNLISSPRIKPQITKFYVKILGKKSNSQFGVYRFFARSFHQILASLISRDTEKPVWGWVGERKRPNLYLTL